MATLVGPAAWVGLPSGIGLLALTRLPTAIRLVRLVLVPPVLVPLPGGIGRRSRGCRLAPIFLLIWVPLVRRIRQRIPE